MNSEQYGEHIPTIIEAAHAGGEQLLQWYGKALETRQKSTVADFQTQADVASEEALLEVLTAAYPDYNVFAEESGWKESGSEYTFIIDPLDGTNNFSLTLPHFSVSIALMKGDETIAAVVHTPVNGYTYSAAKGEGAYVNGTQLAVSTEKEIARSTIATGMGYEGDPAVLARAVEYLRTQNIKRVLRNWSPALDLSLIAAGKIEGFICDRNEIYDNMAGKLLIKEAGGIILDWSGVEETDERSTQYIAACNAEIATQLIKAVE